MIVNTFIITPKDEWRDEACYTRTQYAAKMELMLPERYRPLFSTLIKDQSLNDLMDNRDHKRAYEIMAQAMVSDKEGPWLSHKGESLQHILRKTFYDTLLIIHGDYNPRKYDYFVVALSREVISEKTWEEKTGWEFTGKIQRRVNGQVLIGNFPRAV